MKNTTIFNRFCGTALALTLSLLSAAHPMDRLVQVTPVLNQLEVGLDQRLLVPSGGAAAVPYGERYRHFCPMYALHFAWQMAQNYTKNPDQLSRILSDRDTFDGLLKWFAFFREPKLKPSDLADLTGDALFNHALEFLSSRGKNGENCLERLIVQGSGSEARAGETEDRFARNEIPYIIYIINATTDARKELGEYGSHWVTLLVRRAADGLPEFIVANSVTNEEGGDVRRYQTINDLVEHLAETFAIPAGPGAAAAAAPQVQAEEEDEFARVLRESREAHEKAVKEQEAAEAAALEETGRAYEEEMTAQDAAIKASREAYLKHEQEKTKKRVVRNAHIRELIEANELDRLEEYRQRIIQEEELNPEEVRELNRLIENISDSVINARLNLARKAELEEAQRRDAERFAAQKRKTPSSDGGSQGATGEEPSDEEELAAALAESERLAKEEEEEEELAAAMALSRNAEEAQAQANMEEQPLVPVPQAPVQQVIRPIATYTDAELEREIALARQKHQAGRLATFLAEQKSRRAPK